MELVLYSLQMSRRRSRLSQKTSNTFGLLPSTHPLSIRYKLDFDYIHKLSEDEKLLLSAFCDTYYAADFRDDRFETPVEIRRETYKNKNASNREALAHAQAWGLVDTDVDVEGEGLDPTPTPRYLTDPEYKALLAEYRRVLDCRPKREDLLSEKLSALRLWIKAHG